MAISNQSVREMVEQICGKKANAKFSVKLRDYDSGYWVCNNQSRLFRHTKAIWQSISEMVEAYKANV